VSFDTLPQNPTGINGVTTKRPQRNAPGTFATGTGTTALIRSFFGDKNLDYTAAEVASAIDVKARQINKRLAELVKAKFIEYGQGAGKVKTFQRVIG
jgi:response regulator of citrate/malate metabolism